MKLRNFALIFVTAFATTFFLASCLNEENKIPENCYDGILNNGEQFVDCGGPNCEPCDHCINGVFEPFEGETCTDCGGECGACPQCRNCVKDGDEVGIDCGGTNCGPCSALCGDFMLNGTEEQVDCGGAFCEACPECDDMIMNGTEIGIDCGGTACLPCTTDGNCTNGIVDGDEYWVDCGGTHCPECETILSWKVGNIDHIVDEGLITASATANVLTFSGASGSGGIITVTVTTPSTWTQGATFLCTPATFPANAISFINNGTGVTYTNEFTGANASVVLNRYIPAPNIFRASFSGTLKSDTGLTTSIQNGAFYFDFP